MANIFAGSEIVELGIQIEVNGHAFYRSLAGQTKNKKAKDVFEFLADEEERHIAVFKNLLSSVEKFAPQEVYPGEYIAYMRALASGHVFTRKGQGAKTAKDAKNDKDAVELGIGFEKDSIIFYEGMKGSVPDKDHGALDSLIAQEQGHLVKLTELKAKL